jgi:ACS family glucarate transporter-like MFS transporter
MGEKKRFFVYIGLFLLMFINYVDRMNLSVAAKNIVDDYNLSPIQLGYIFSAYLWTYLILLIPMGLAADRFGGRTITYASLALWSIAGIWTGLTTTYASLFASRLVLGVGEASTYPSGGKIIREWAPPGERGLATAFLNTGAHAGLCFGSVMVGWLIVQFGWRESFYITGAVGLVLAAVWFLYYRRPDEASWLGDAERHYIQGKTTTIDATKGEFRAGVALKSLLRSRSMWALALTQGCAGYTLYLFMTWLPNYMVIARRMGVLKSSLFTAIPYGSAVVIGLGLGWLSDRFLAREGRAPADRRKLTALLLLMSSVILGTPFVDSIWVIVGLISVSLGCVATAMAMNIALTTDLLTDGRCNGVAVSLLIVGGNTFGVAAPIVTGYIVAATDGFSGAFSIAGALLLAGAAIVMIGANSPIHVELSPTSSDAVSLEIA